MFADDHGARGTDLLLQLAQHGGARVFILVDAALRQLPATRRPLGIRQVRAARHEYLARSIEQRRSDIPPVWQRGWINHRSVPFAGCPTSALTGANARPSAVSPSTHAASRWIVIGRGAVASPRAVPLLWASLLS